MSSPPITIGLRDTLSRARKLMIRHGIGGLIVVDDRGSPRGVIGSRELERAMREEGVGEKPLDHLIVGDFMKTPVVTVSEEDGIVTAARILLEEEVSRLPVIDGEGKISGVITTHDVLGVYGRLSKSSTRVEEVMVKDPPKVSPQHSIFYAIEKMESFEARRVIVVDVQNRPIGIITPKDILSLKPFIKMARKPAMPKRVRIRYSIPIVEDVMTTPVFAARRDESLVDVAMRMYVEGVGSLPVIDEKGVLMGLVTRKEILEDMVETGM